jgi:hypothetical protein
MNEMRCNQVRLLYQYRTTLTVVAAALTGAVMGCAREEKIIEIKAPGTSVEVRKSGDGATVEVQGNKIEVERK